jgi:hypothetical protein
MTHGGERAGSDELLRDVLSSWADSVPVSPDAYHSVRAEWVRRQRRRRRLGVLTATVLVALADIVGLWALNNMDADDTMMFDDRPPSQQQEPSTPRIGPP